MKTILLVFGLLLLTGINTLANTCDDCVTIPQEAEALAGGESLVLTRDEDIIFLYRATRVDIDNVGLCCGIQENLILLDEESRLWSLTYHVPRLDEAVIGYSFWEWIGDTPLTPTDYQVWRGENAPEAPSYANPLRGHVEDEDIQSTSLNELRGLTIYYPPDYDARLNYPVIYLADGQSVWGYAGRIEQLIRDGDIVPMLLVGVHSGEYRAEEYLPSLDRERFALHERFFTEEVRLWAEERLGASTEASQRAVYGHSNGGVFAAAMALLHSDIYSIALPFSAGLNPFESFRDAEIDPDLKLYFAAGTLETGFFNNTQRLAKRFAEAGADVTFSERVAGHDFVMWGEEFYHGVKWAFGGN